MRGQDIYNSQDEATTSPSSSESEEAKGEEFSEEIYPQEDGQPLVVKEKCKEVSVSSKRLAKKETHFTIKTKMNKRGSKRIMLTTFSRSTRHVRRYMEKK